MSLGYRFEGAAPQPLEPCACPSCGQIFYGHINLTHEILCPLIQKGQMDKWTRPIIFTHLKLIPQTPLMRIPPHKPQQEDQA